MKIGIIIISFCVLSKFSWGQMININNYNKFDSILNTNTKSKDTIVIWGNYLGYVMGRLVLSSAEKKKIKQPISNSAIQFTLFDTDIKQSYCLKSDENLFIYNKNDIIKLQLVVNHDFRDNKGNKIIIVNKIL